MTETEPTFKGAFSKELNYITDKDGKYITKSIDGWEPKALALDFSLAEIQERMQTAMEKIATKKASPLLYFMEKSRMDTAILAAYMNQWEITVKLHLKPFFFNRLTEKKLQQYATLFKISTQELQNLIPQEHEN